MDGVRKRLGTKTRAKIAIWSDSNSKTNDKSNSISRAILSDYENTAR